MALDNLVLKADLHIHTKEDPFDSGKIDYSAFELIEHLDSKGFDVFSITLHNFMFGPEQMRKVRDYAKQKGMLYIPGIEKTIEEDHILIYNIDKEDAEGLRDYKDIFRMLMKYGIQGRREPLLVGAAHPEFPSRTAMHEKMERWHNVIHFVEYNAFYMKGINFNNGGVRQANNHHKPMLGNSDAHDLERIGKTYTEIMVPPDAFFSRSRHFMPGNKDEFKSLLASCSDESYEQAKQAVVYYIKKGDMKVMTGPLSPLYVFKYLLTKF
jgi:predicted metal-dependent phosphoesterase TrpH